MPTSFSGRILPRNARHGLHDRTRDRDAGHARDTRVEFLVEARARRAHREIRHAEQAARRQLDLVRRDTIDQVHGEAERDAQRNRDHRDDRAAGSLPQRPEGRGIEQREPCADAGVAAALTLRHRRGAGRSRSPARVSS